MAWTYLLLGKCYFFLHFELIIIIINIFALYIKAQSLLLVGHMHGMHKHRKMSKKQKGKIHITKIFFAKRNLTVAISE